MSRLTNTQTYTGTVKKERVNVGSKSERDAFVFEPMRRCAEGAVSWSIRVHDGNAMYDARLEAFVGKNVQITGFLNSGHDVLFVDGLADIVLWGSDKKASRSHHPKP